MQARETVTPSAAARAGAQDRLCRLADLAPSPGGRSGETIDDIKEPVRRWHGAIL
ncbi:hypothetical protein AN936_10075 [Sphingopyxis macrogoltabida]|uniref:Uncharacterized protein n=1 Tax=Sphingopyxis macrogoltabida TaxID=33050 RepID=A0A0N9UV30_SPHMC|nr:hypothetical protein AN936_10075 [Sphingopyxis macrogoltabida]